jgi:hypothetical protein
MVKVWTRVQIEEEVVNVGFKQKKISQVKVK